METWTVPRMFCSMESHWLTAMQVHSFKHSWTWTSDQELNRLNNFIVALGRLKKKIRKEECEKDLLKTFLNQDIYLSLLQQKEQSKW
jgi:hypothetical protein